MKKSLFYIIIGIILAGCNSITVKPGTMQRGEMVYTDRGGFTMRRSIKNELEQRGYTVVVGKAVKSREYYNDDNELEIETATIPSNARYYVKVRERREYIRPIWCALNGFWWWNFNISVADQETGRELMTWRGRGCADSSMRLLRRTLDKLETK